MAVRVITVKERILEANDKQAARNRRFLRGKGVLGVNVMSSPGAGKTSLILATIEKLAGRVRAAVIEGDVASTVDADRVASRGVPVVQINTAGGCHLDGYMIREAMGHLPLGSIDLLFVENVGNLICPAEFDLGEHKRVMLLSLPEGDDKPHKYPLMFSQADVVLVSKMDLAPYLDFDLAAFGRAVVGLNPDVRIIPVSARTGEGLEPWLSWLGDEVEALKKGVHQRG